MRRVRRTDSLFFLCSSPRLDLEPLSIHSSITTPTVAPTNPTSQQLSRAKSSSSDSSKKEKDRNASPSPSASGSGTSTHPLRTSTSGSSTSSATGTAGKDGPGSSPRSLSLGGVVGSSTSAGAPDRRPGHGAMDKTSPAPPLVVVSGAPNSENGPDGMGGASSANEGGSPTMGSPPTLGGVGSSSSPGRAIGVGGVGGLTVGMAGIGLEGRHQSAGSGGVGGQPPKAGQLTKLRQGPRDTIPIVGKSPRKQRSSRFHVTEKVHLDKLPGFNGESQEFVSVVPSERILINSIVWMAFRRAFRRGQAGGTNRPLYPETPTMFIHFRL